MQYYVTMTDKGVKAIALPGKDLPKDVFYTFSSCLFKFAHLLQINVKLSGNDLCALIDANYQQSPKIDNIKKAVLLAMPS